MRKSWTDERLDDMNRRMEDGFNRLDAELRALRAETKTEIDGLRSEVGAFQRTVLQLGSGAIATFVVGFAGLIVAQL